MFDSVSSSTGLWTAAARARETSRVDALFHDELAEQLAGEVGLNQLSAREPDGVENPYLPVRTRFFDDVVRAGARSIHQIVLLGAGMDTRAFRLGLSAATSVFEVDRADVLEYKSRALDGTVPSCDRRIVPADLDEDWMSALRRADFRGDDPTLWIAEGLLFYLTDSAVRRVLENAARCSASGSEFVADIFGTGLLELPSMRPLVDARRLSGAELPFCTDDPETVFADSGWSDSRLVPAYQFAEQVGRRMPATERQPAPVSTLTSSFLTATSPKV